MKPDTFAYLVHGAEVHEAHVLEGGPVGVGVLLMVGVVPAVYECVDY